MAEHSDKGKMFTLPPSQDDVYLVIRVPKEDLKPGMRIGEVKILPTDPVLGCICETACCDDYNPCFVD